MTTPDELRKAFKKYCKKEEKIWREWEKGNFRGSLPDDEPFPEEFRGMTCGAKTRAGTPCKRTDIYDNGRCKFHGGLSTGPKTQEGKKRSGLNGKLPKKKRTP